MLVEDFIDTSIAPGQQVNRIFNYLWYPTAALHNIKVCADNRQNIVENNEENNCRETIWQYDLPDLIVDNIECTANNKLAVIIKNIGTGSLPDYWTANADVYFDNIRQGFFSLVSPTNNFNGGIQSSGGSAVYILGW
jgi:hypothetical protein